MTPGENTGLSLRVLEQAVDILLLEDIQRQVWVGADIEVVPANLLVAAVHNGGLAIGAYLQDRLVGFVFGFPGLYQTPDGPRLKHHSHMLAVLPEFRDRGIGYALKRAQWQLVRRQGLDRITWTYDPLQSRNANLNISRLGAVCSTYLPDYYGEMRDILNAGTASDRFQVDWWVDSARVNRRLSRRARGKLDLAHFYSAGAEIINPGSEDEEGYPRPPETDTGQIPFLVDARRILLVEIPADFDRLRAARPEFGRGWRSHTRALFQLLFTDGYLITDFIFLPGRHPRGFYVLTHGESTL